MDKTIDIDGQQLFYRQTGEGKPLILMHGWGCNSSTVDSIAKTASVTYTVYNVDFPGFGNSPEPETVWGVEEYTALIEKFADKLNLENPVLTGHSFGGRVAILFASRRKTDRIILIDAAGIKPKRKLSYYLKVYSFKASKLFLKFVLGKNKSQKIIEERRKKSGSADYANASPKMRAILSKVVNEDLSDKLHLVSSPTLLIWGEIDKATPLSDAKKMEKLIPDAGLVSFPGCGHYSFLDNPRQFAATLTSFLNAKIQSCS